MSVGFIRGWHTCFMQVALKFDIGELEESNLRDTAEEAYQHALSLRDGSDCDVLLKQLPPNSLILETVNQSQRYKFALGVIKEHLEDLISSR